MKGKRIYRAFIKILSLLLSFGMGVASLFAGSDFKSKIEKYKNDPLELSENFTITAHSGACMTIPNTISSINTAIAANVDILEVDVTFRPDGTAVIVHSSSPNRFRGRLFEKALKTVSEYEDMKMNLDLKAFWNLPVIQELVIEYDMLERVFFTGVSEKEVETVKKDCPLIPFYLNASLKKDKYDDTSYAKELADKIMEIGAVGLNTHYGNMSKTIVDVLHDNGLLVSAWTVNKQIDLYFLLSIGVDNITTLRPLKLDFIIENWNK